MDRFKLIDLLGKMYRVPREAADLMKSLGLIQWMASVNVPDPRGAGIIKVTPEVLRVARKGKILLRYFAGSKGVAPGGSLFLVIKAGGLLPPLQVSDPLAANYVKCVASNGAPLKVDLERDLYYYIWIRLQERGLREGQSILVILGDDSEGSPGMTLREFACKIVFEAWVDCYGREEFIRLQDQPSVRIVGGPASTFDVIVPSIIYPEEPIKTVVRAVDHFGNVVPDYTGPIRIVGDGFKFTQRFEKRDKGVISFDLPYSTFGDKKRFKISVEDANGNLKGFSNPSTLKGRDDEYGKGGYRIFWGDIHGHTGLSSAAYGTPFEYYEFARDVAALDFCALTDHDHYMTPEKWAIIREAASAFNEPHKFVTFLGYEWTHGSGGGTLIPGKYFGHKCVYFPTDVGTYYTYTRMEEAPDPESLWRCLEGTGALVIPHHTAYPLGYDQVSGTDWRYHNPRFERLVEIYSRHGSSEKAGGLRPIMVLERLRSGKIKRTPAFNPEGSVQGALARGLRLGFVAGSDTQLGCPGNQIRNEPRASSSYNGGLTAVYARELTRSSIWEALWNRRCYATTGQRIVLSFKVNGHIMGEEFRLRGNEPRTIHAEVLGTSEISKVTVVRDGEDWYIHKGTSTHEEITVVDNSPLKKVTYYYVRILQEDGGMAWSSPIWASPSKV